MISVLYVDDEEALLDLGKFFLESTGQFTVDIAQSGPDAIDLLKAKHYDAVVSDYQMPFMDGLELLALIRKDYPHLPFIIFTGKGREEIVIRAYESGADFYLQKGGDPKSVFTELTHKIRISVEQRESHRMLRESEKRFRLLVENAPYAIFIQTDWHFAYVNPATVHLFGARKAQDLLGTPVLDRFHPEYHPMISQRIHSLNDQKSPVATIEEVYLRLDGTSVDVEVSAVPVTYEEKDGAIVFVRDITARKCADQTLEASEKRYRFLFEHMQEGLASCRVLYNSAGEPDDWLIFNANPASMRLTGLADIVGKRITEVVPDLRKENPELFDTCVRVARTGTPKSLEVFIGPLRIWLAISLYSPEKDQFIAVFDNITGRKKTEEALKTSEQMYRLVADNVGDVIWILDLDTERFTYVSPSVGRLRGFTPEEVMTQAVSETVTRESYRMMSKNLSGRLKAYQSGDDSVRVQVDTIDQLRKDGSAVPTEIVTTLLGGSDRVVHQIIGVSRDLTTRRQDEEASATGS